MTWLLDLVFRARVALRLTRGVDWHGPDRVTLAPIHTSRDDRLAHP